MSRLLGEEDPYRPFKAGDILFLAPDAEGRYWGWEGGELRVLGRIVGTFRHA